MLKRLIPFGVALLVVAGGTVPSSAQTAAQTPVQTTQTTKTTTLPAVSVEVEPIECYWRTSSTAVRIGQPFALVLTCNVLDTTATTVVPDQSRLEPAVLQLQPFEVVDGRQAPGLKTANRRFFQYEYSLRYIGEDIGKDLAIPALTIVYRVQSRVQADSAAVESRERQYVLPARPIRIVSLLPPVVGDIRDEPPPTFAEVEATHFAASVLRMISWVLFALGGAVAVWTLISVAQRRRGAAPTVVRHASDAAILKGVSRELADVERQRTAGWTDALAARALSALRVAASIATGRPVSQTPAVHGVAAGAGQFQVPARWPRGGDVLISGSATSRTLGTERQLAAAAGARPSARVAVLEEALGIFAAATYGRAATAMDAAALDDALAAGARELAGLRREHTWIALKLRSLAQSAAGVRTRAWAR